MPTFSADVVAAVLHHMNDDHVDDNLLIVRAFGPTGAEKASSARMTGLDEQGGDWSYVVGEVEHATRIPWPAGEIAERAQIRREVVALYDAACARLGVEPRPHD